MEPILKWKVGAQAPPPHTRKSVFSVFSLLFALIEIGDIDIINISSDTNKFFLLFLSFLADVCPNPFDLLALFCLLIRDARSLVLGLGRPILFHEFKKLVTSSSFEFPLLFYPFH